VQPTLANIVGWKLVVSGVRSGTCFVFETKKFPRMHSEIALPGGQMKDQHKQCKLAAIFVLSSSICITHNAFFVTDMFLCWIYHTDTG